MFAMSSYYVYNVNKLNNNKFLAHFFELCKSSISLDGRFLEFSSTITHELHSRNLCK